MLKGAGFGLDSQDLKLGVVFDRYGILSNRRFIPAQGVPGALDDTGDVWAWHDFFPQICFHFLKNRLTLADNESMRGCPSSLPRSQETAMLGEHELEPLKAQVHELKVALQWERTQKEQLLEEQSGFRREIKRLQDRVTEVERQLAEKSHEPAHT